VIGPRKDERAVDLSAKIEKDDDGMLWAQVEQLPGCFASGETIPELLEALTEAVSLYLADAGRPPVAVPQFSSLGMRVAVPA